MNRKLLSGALTVAALISLGTFASAAFAKEKAVTTREKYTVEPYEEAYYFGSGPIYCHGLHKTNSLFYPGIGTGHSSRGGEDVETCKKKKGLIEGVNHAGTTLNLLGAFWNSDFDGQGSYGIDYEKSKVATNGKSFKIVVIYPLVGARVTDEQEISGSEAGFTTSPLTAEVGKTVDYEIAVRNNGWVAETLPAFFDPSCDAGTLAGGPGAGTLAPGETTTYTCSHLLTETGTVSGLATVKVVPPGEHGPSLIAESNKVETTAASAEE